MEEFVKQTFLYDFYGELLTEHQREIYEAYVLENLSLSEIASEKNISRQGVHDIIKRCNLQLSSYEDKLQLVKKFQDIKSMVSNIDECENLQEVKNIAGKILEIL